MMGLCLGLFAIKYAISGKWEVAVMLVIIASFIDGIDGGVARLLDATSKFGAQLDSLADFFNFTVAPAFILYFWKTHEIKGIGWAATIFFIMCGAIRLARFNAMQDGEDEELKDGRFFTGMPSPSAADLSLLPMIFTFLAAEKFDYVLNITPVVVIITMSVLGILMVSRLPTISLKKIKIRKEFSSLVMAAAGLFIVALITEPWITLPLLGLGYILTIPVTLWLYYRG
jgi:CDP-diacylglycerol--serine O-phosphatidyltransferase